MPRPTKFNNSITVALCKWIEQGCTFKDACAIEGISFQTFNEWRKDKPEFSESIKKAEAQSKAARIETILKASEKHWQAAAWWLERRYPEDFALKRILEVQKDDSPDPAELLMQKLIERATEKAAIGVN